MSFNGCKVVSLGFRVVPKFFYSVVKVFWVFAYWSKEPSLNSLVFWSLDYLDSSYNVTTNKPHASVESPA